MDNAAAQLGQLDASVRELLIGCGNSRRKKLGHTDGSAEFQNLTTLDIDPACKPDIVHDLEDLPYPVEDQSFDEIYAFEVLEHTGQQGDWKFFFAQWSEFYRILRPNGLFIGTVPLWTSPWAWADPGHKRVLPQECFVFLDQEEYEKQVGVTAMADYRGVWEGDFVLEACEALGDINLAFILRKRATS